VHVKDTQAVVFFCASYTRVASMRAIQLSPTSLPCLVERSRGAINPVANDFVGRAPVYVGTRTTGVWTATPSAVPLAPSTLRCSAAVTESPVPIVAGVTAEAPLRVVIVGAGIGGLVLALGLLKKGFQVQILERDLTAIRGEGKYRGPIQARGRVKGVASQRVCGLWMDLAPPAIQPSSLPPHGRRSKATRWLHCKPLMTGWLIACVRRAV
jgi:hypothetical protein